MGRERTRRGLPLLCRRTPLPARRQRRSRPRRGVIQAVPGNRTFRSAGPATAYQSDGKSLGLPRRGQWPALYSRPRRLVVLRRESLGHPPRQPLLILLLLLDLDLAQDFLTHREECPLAARFLLHIKTQAV